jgi:antitoxin VapB
MDTAKLFKNGRSQAVRLPKAYSLPGNEVFVTKVDGVVMLIPKNQNHWQPLIRSLEKFSENFFNFPRDQGAFEKRESIE